MEKDLTAIVTELMRQGMTKEDLAAATKEAQDILYKEEDELIEQHPWDYPDKGALCKYYDKLVRKELDTESGLVLLLAVMKQLTPSIDISGVTLDDIKRFDADLAELEKLSKEMTRKSKIKNENDLNVTLDDLINFFEF